MDLELIRELTPEEQHQRDLERLQAMRPMDDTFMREMFRDCNELAQFVLRIITGIEDLQIVSAETQYDLQHLLGARSICLDVLATDSKGRKYNLEIQRASMGATPKRARYHAGALAVESLKVRNKFDELPITYVIFITEEDVRKEGRAVYVFEKMDTITKKPLGDDEYIIFVNGAYRNKEDNSELAKLIHDFSCSNADDMYLSEWQKERSFSKRIQKE